MSITGISVSRGARRPPFARRQARHYNQSIPARQRSAPARASSKRPPSVAAIVEGRSPLRERNESELPVDAERGAIEIVDEEARAARLLEDPPAQLGDAAGGEATAAPFGRRVDARDLRGIGGAR